METENTKWFNHPTTALKLINSFPALDKKTTPKRGHGRTKKLGIQYGDMLCKIYKKKKRRSGGII